MTAYDRHVTHRETREHLTLVGPMAKSKAVIAALFDDGWEVHRTGPYTDAGMFPGVDTGRFLVTASRVVREGN